MHSVKRCPFEGDEPSDTRNLPQLDRSAAGNAWNRQLQEIAGEAKPMPGACWVLTEPPPSFRQAATAAPIRNPSKGTALDDGFRGKPG